MHSDTTILGTASDYLQHATSKEVLQSELFFHVAHMTGCSRNSVATTAPTTAPTTGTTPLTGKTKGERRRRTVYKTQIKYRHPSDPSKEWSGLGPRLKWFQEAVNSGESLASLAVSE